MTKKDYQRIADIILYNRNQCGLPDRAESNSDRSTRLGYVVALNDTAYMLADEFARYNPRFDRARFLTACGLTADSE